MTASSPPPARNRRSESSLPLKHERGGKTKRKQGHAFLFGRRTSALLNQGGASRAIRTTNRFVRRRRNRSEPSLENVLRVGRWAAFTSSSRLRITNPISHGRQYPPAKTAKVTFSFFGILATHFHSSIFCDIPRSTSQEGTKWHTLFKLDIDPVITTTIRPAIRQG